MKIVTNAKENETVPYFIHIIIICQQKYHFAFLSLMVDIIS